MLKDVAAVLTVFQMFLYVSNIIMLSLPASI